MKKLLEKIKDLVQKERRIAIPVAIIICGCVFVIIRYFTSDMWMIKSEPDQVCYSSDVNTFPKRGDDWHKISRQAILTHEQFAGIDGSTGTLPITTELARQFYDVSDTDMWGYVHHNKTDVAYENLIMGNDNHLNYRENDKPMEASQRVRILFATPPSVDEYEQAKNEGVTLEVDPVALDGFVFITHKDNPVESLTVQQIRDIYSGKITNWKMVGGKFETIRAYQRTKNSGSQTAMEEMVMNGEPMVEPPTTFVALSMGELLEDVAEYDNSTAAIGYTYYYYINKLYINEDIKVIKIDGISPDNENLISGKYPFTNSYCAVIRSDEPEDSPYRALRDYLLTDEGQQIIEMAGYCPVR